MNKIAVFAGLPLLMLADANVLEATGGIDMSGTIVRLISFLLGVCGATYLAAGCGQGLRKGQ